MLCTKAIENQTTGMAANNNMSGLAIVLIIAKRIPALIKIENVTPYTPSSEYL